MGVRCSAVRLRDFVGFLMMRLIHELWKPKINISQACSCILQISLKAIKTIIFRGDSH